MQIPDFYSLLWYGAQVLRILSFIPLRLTTTGYAVVLSVFMGSSVD